MSFSSLPVEIISLILDLLHDKYDVRQFLCLSQINALFRSVCLNLSVRVTREYSTLPPLLQQATSYYFTEKPEKKITLSSKVKKLHVINHHRRSFVCTIEGRKLKNLTLGGNNFVVRLLMKKVNLLTLLSQVKFDKICPVSWLKFSSVKVGDTLNKLTQVRRVEKTALYREMLSLSRTMPLLTHIQGFNLSTKHLLYLPCLQIARECFIPTTERGLISYSTHSPGHVGMTRGVFDDNFIFLDRIEEGNIPKIQTKEAYIRISEVPEDKREKFIQVVRCLTQNVKTVIWNDGSL